MENTQVGPFLILRKLGTSRRQKVYHARQIEQARDVALKFISVPPKVPWHQALEKLNREFDQLQQLKHPNLIQVYGAGVDGDRVFFATELVEGESLAALLSRRGKLAPDQVVEYGRQIAEVLEYLHAKDLIHSKLNPEKILVTPAGSLKVGDLRLNRAKRRRWDASKQRELDMAAYMAPEQFTEGATHKSDLYALGVILFEMLTGKLPYPPDTLGRMTRNKLESPAPTVATHVMNCPIWLDRLVTQLLSPNPRSRPHSASAVKMAFDEIRNIDATRKTAAAQITSGFNPLTAGQDQAEARRVLGKQSRKNADRGPLLQSTGFQVTALLVICLLVVYFWWPPSHQSLVERARTLVQSDDPDQWREAQLLMQDVMDSSGDYAEQATDLYFESRQKSLINRVENGKVTRFDTEEFQQFSKAARLEREGQEADAADIYARLMTQLSPTGDQRHIQREAKLRYDQLQTQFQWPEDPVELQLLIDETRDISDQPGLLRAQKMLGNLTIEFAGREGFETILTQAQDRRREIREQLLELAKPAESREPKDGASAPDR